METDITYHYPPELLRLLTDTIPVLCRTKLDILTFFKGAGVSAKLTSDFFRKVSEDASSVNKYQIVREVLARLNDAGEKNLRERREVLKRVVEWEDFSICWANDQHKAMGLVAQIRQTVNVKDSFSRIRQEREQERRDKIKDKETALATINKRKVELERIKKEFYALFAEKDAHKRGKQLETVLNNLFRSDGILIREAFTLVKNDGNGVMEQIDGVIELEGQIYLVEMKWWKAPLGTAEVSPHLVKVYGRGDARGILISYSGFTPAAIDTCKGALTQKVIILSELQELVLLLEKEGDLREFFRQKVRAAIAEKNPHYIVK